MLTPEQEVIVDETIFKIAASMVTLIAHRALQLVAVLRADDISVKVYSKHVREIKRLFAALSDPTPHTSMEVSREGQDVKILSAFDFSKASGSPLVSVQTSGLIEGIRFEADILSRISRYIDGEGGIGLFMQKDILDRELAKMMGRIVVTSQTKQIKKSNKKPFIDLIEELTQTNRARFRDILRTDLWAEKSWSARVSGPDYGSDGVSAYFKALSVETGYRLWEFGVSDHPKYDHQMQEDVRFLYFPRELDFEVFEAPYPENSIRVLPLRNVADVDDYISAHKPAIRERIKGRT